MALSLGTRYAADARASLPFRHGDALMLSVFATAGERLTAEQVAAALGALPAVVSAAQAEMLPLLPETIQAANRVQVRGAPALADTVLLRNGVAPAFFETLGVEIVSGRTFADASTEIVLSRAAARLLAQDAAAALGMALELVPASLGAGPAGGVATVVGVVDDVPYASMLAGEAAAQSPVLYGPPRSDGGQLLWLVRLADVRGAADEVLGHFGESAYRVGTPTEIFRERFLAAHSVGVALAGAAIFALLLSLVGVGASVARSVAAASRDIGIFLAVGMTARDIALRHLRRVARDLLAAGVAVCAAAVAANYLLASNAVVIEPWLMLAVLPVIALVCALFVFRSVKRLVRDHPVSALVGGADA